MAFDPSRMQLLVVDVQERLASAMPEAVLARTLRANETLVVTARALGIPVTFTEQYPRGLGPTVAQLAASDPFEKLAFAATDEAGFDARLLPGRTVVLTGMEAHICVAHTAAGLRSRGVEVIVVADAVCSRREADAAHGLAWAASLGASVLPSETVIFGWLGRAGGPVFKDVSARIR